MQINLSPDEVTSLMLRLPVEARGASFSYAEPELTVPEEWEEAANAVMAQKNWRVLPPIVETTPVAKLSAFLAANPDVAALISA